MGCKQSKPNYTASVGTSLRIDAVPETTEYGIECSEPRGIPPVQAEPTPHDIRKIRDELFAKDSLVAVASSCTPDTAPSWESTDPLYYGPDNTRAINKSTATKTYHYPMALYEEMKGIRHFVPRTGSSTKPSSSIRSIAMDTNFSGLSQLDISDRSYISGLSQLDLSDRSLRGFPQQEHLVDTMSFSGRSFGNLVDMMTEIDEEKLEGEEGDSGERDNLGCSYRSGPGKFYVQSRHSRHSASPFIEQTLSYKILADMKALALLTDVQKKSTHEMVEADESRKCGDGISCTGASSIKYHRTASEMPSDTRTVCSDIGTAWIQTL